MTHALTHSVASVYYRFESETVYLLHYPPKATAVGVIVQSRASDIHGLPQVLVRSHRQAQQMQVLWQQHHRCLAWDRRENGNEVLRSTRSSPRCHVPVTWAGFAYWLGIDPAHVGRFKGVPTIT